MTARVFEPKSEPKNSSRRRGLKQSALTLTLSHPDPNPKAVLTGGGCPFGDVSGWSPRSYNGKKKERQADSMARQP